MNKTILLLLLVASQFLSPLSAQEMHAQNKNGQKVVQAHAPVEDSQTTKLAMGDIGSIQSSLNDSSTSQASNKKWAQLSDDQRKVLSPLGPEWDTLRPWQREKMLDIARDYPKMDAQKQQRVQKRLNSWSRMTPYERENARKRYMQFYALSADKQDEVRKKWADYQKLSEAEREKIRKESPELAYDPELE